MNGQSHGTMVISLGIFDLKYSSLPDASSNGEGLCSDPVITVGRKPLASNPFTVPKLCLGEAPAMGGKLKAIYKKLCDGLVIFP